MPTLAEQRSATLAKARATVDRALSERRELSSAESAEVEAAVEHVKSLDHKIKGVNLAKQVMSFNHPNPEDSDSVFSPDATAGIIHALKSRTTYRTTVDAKALLTNTMLPPSGEGVVPGLHPSLAFALSSLFTNAPADGPVQRFYQFTSGTASVVAEGQPKLDANLGVVPVDLPLEKIAATSQVSSEADMDSPYLISQVTAELQAAVAQEETARILFRFANTSGVLTAAGATADVVDILADSVAAQEGISGVTPNAIVANPQIVAAIRKSKSSGSGQYTLDPTAAGPTSIFGVNVYSTPATGPGTVWLVESSGVTIYRRGGLTVDVGTNADDWQRNLETLRCEERVATAVLRPTCLTRVTLSA